MEESTTKYRDISLFRFQMYILSVRRLHSSQLGFIIIIGTRFNNSNEIDILSIILNHNGISTKQTVIFTNKIKTIRRVIFAFFFWSSRTASNIHDFISRNFEWLFFPYGTRAIIRTAGVVSFGILGPGKKIQCRGVCDIGSGQAPGWKITVFAVGAYRGA